MTPIEEPKKIILIHLLAVAVCIPSLIWLTMPARDSSLYALLSLEFSQGNFSNAFNADFPPLLTALGGTINAFVNNPFLANKIASILLFLPGVLGTYVLAREMKNHQIGLTAATLYAICPYTIELATSGGVDSGKLGFLPWFAWATYKWCNNGKISFGIGVGVIGAVLSYARGEGILFAGLALLVFPAHLITSRKKTAGPSFKNRLVSFFAASFVLLLLISPWIAYETKATGYVVTHPSQIRIYKLLDTFTKAMASEVPSPHPSDGIGRNALSSEEKPKAIHIKGTQIHWLKNIEKSVKGLYIPFLLLAGLGITCRRHHRERLSRRDTFPLIFVGLNFAIFFPTPVCNSRYFQPLIPLYLHLAGIGVLTLWAILAASRFFSEKRIRILTFAAIIIFALLSQKELDFFRSEQKIEKEKAYAMIGEWIKKHREALPFYGVPENSRVFHNGRRPVILSSDYRIGYYSLSDCVVIPRELKLSPEQLVELCKRDKVSLVLLDNGLKENCPEFSKYWKTHPAFQPMDTGDGFPKHNQPIRLLRFDPSLSDTH